MCFECGHCTAVCPKEAISINGVAAEQLIKLEKIGPVIFSLGRFINKDARKMLSAFPELCKGMQKEFAGHVAARKEGRDTIFFNAPHLVIVYADTRNMVHDACITALTQLELIAHSYDIGTCWSGVLGVYSKLTPSFEKEVGIPKREKPHVIWK